MSSDMIKTLQLNGSKYDDVQESKSLIAVHEQQLFVWHNSESCILTSELGRNDAIIPNECISLLPTNPPVFEVDSMSFNRIGTLLALIGVKGIMVVQIPWLSRIVAAKEQVFCRSWHIAERFFVCVNRVKILQVLWHPGSINCNHLVVLSSDNYLRLYDATDSQIPLQAVQLGPVDGLSLSPLKPSFSANLDSAISFDFGPPETDVSNSKSLGFPSENELSHPIYVLHANGDVFTLTMSLKKSSSQVKVKGPLAMYPPAEDNYGVDACSLICLHSSPPVLVIAMATGVLYHCILLDSGIAEDRKVTSSSIINISFNDEPEVALYVHGSVELPILPSEELSAMDSLPMRLYKDPTSYRKYHCSPVCGIHTVVVSFIQKLEELTDKNDATSLVSQLQSDSSLVEHLLCTRPLSSMKEVPVIGLASSINDKGVSLICLLASWEFVHLPLLSSFQSMTAPLLMFDESNSASTPESAQEEKFSQQIQHLLHRSTSIPLLKAHVSAEKKGLKGASQEYMELLWNTTNRFREEYIDRLSSVHSLIEHRANVLVRYKKQQLQELEWHLQEKAELRNKAEALAEKYEDAHASQQLLFERIETVMKLLQQRYPILSTAENALKHDLVQMEGRIKVLEQSLDQLKKKLHCRADKEKQSKSLETLQNKMEALTFNDCQLSHIKEMLCEMNGPISRMVKTVVTLKKDTGV